MGDLMWYMCSGLLGVCGARPGSGYKNSISQSAVVSQDTTAWGVEG